MEGLATLLQEVTRSLTGCHVSRQAVWDLLTQHTQPGAAGNLWDILSQPASSMLGAYYAAFAKATWREFKNCAFRPGKLHFPVAPHRKILPYERRSALLWGVPLCLAIIPFGREWRS